MKKNIYPNRRVSSSSTSKFKRYKDEPGLQYLTKNIPLEDNKTLEDKIGLISENFDMSDKKFKKYSDIKFKLNNGKLFLGEVTKYQKKLKEIKSEMFEIFYKTWNELVRYRYDIPSETFKIYRSRYDKYNYDVTRNTFKGTILEGKY